MTVARGGARKGLTDMARNILMRPIVLMLLLAMAAIPARALDTAARAALVVDHETGTDLLAKNADTPLPPASMSKLMTLFMVFEALQEGRLSLDDTFRVSVKAWQMGGSKMFLREGNEVRIEDLIRGVIVHSGNDACVVLAEGLAGSETAFAQRMTKRARELGMMDSTFSNSTGWPHPDHRMSARDLVTLARLIIDRFPEYYGYFAEQTFTWDDIEQSNRNPLLGLGLGADGLKTGHTEEAGYGLVGSAEMDGRRITFMVSGLSSSQERLNESERLLNWAFRDFAVEELFPADTAIASADVWLGAKKTVGLVAEVPVEAVIPWQERANVETWVEYEGPVEAPIAAGQEIAELVISIPGLSERRVPLRAAADVAAGGFVTRFTAAAGVLAARAQEMVLGGDG